MHALARVYGLSEALEMTPRQIACALGIEAKASARDLKEKLLCARLAYHGEKKDFEKALKGLG